MFVNFSKFWLNFGKIVKKSKTQNSFINQMLHFIKYTNLGNAAGGGETIEG